MKEITVGDISIYSEEGESWEELIKVIRKANKAYRNSLEKPEKKTWINRLLKGKLL